MIVTPKGAGGAGAAAFVHAPTISASPKEADTLADERSGPTAPEAGRERWDASRLPVVDARSYDVAGEVAQGGIGRILRARDLRLGRPVALKELLDGGGGAEERFVREAVVTARLQHPSIVPIYEAGRWPNGAPFYAMKLVSGRSLADVIEERRTPVQRLGLLRHVLAAAEAVAYAHSRRIIHRDLKPANVLVGDFGETVVIDWGLAKDLGEEEGAGAPAAAPSEPAASPLRNGLTLAGAVMGTPTYMPPEQAAGLPVDERADVYALGAILYHTLSGAAPYDGTTSREILSKVSAAPPPPLASLQRDISEDLLAIVAKAMAREPGARYPSARELAEDLRRFETGQIVGAHRYSPVDLLRRFMRRYRAPLVVAAAALVAVVLAVAVGVQRTIAERIRAEEQKAQAEAARREAVVRADDLTLVQARASVDRDPNLALAWLKLLSPSFDRWSAARVIAADAAARGLATVLRGHTDAVNALAFSPDGGALATVGDDRSLRLWDVATGEGRALAGHTDEVWNAVFSPDGSIVATGSKDRTVRLWDVATGESRLLSGHEAGVGVLVFSAGGDRLTSACSNSVRVWDVATGAQLHELRRDKGLVSVLSQGGEKLAQRDADGALWIHDLASRERRVLVPGGPRATLDGVPGAALLFSPDGAALAERFTDGAVRLWDVATGRSQLLPRGGPVTLPVGFSPSRLLTFSPDGSKLVSLGEGSTARVWDTRRAEPRVLRGHEGGIMRAVFSPDGKLLATGGFDHTARLWDLETGQSRVLHGHDDVIVDVEFSRDGKLVATASVDHTVRVFPVEIASSRLVAAGAPSVSFSGFSPDGELVAAGGEDGAVRIWSAGGGTPRVLEGHEGDVVAVIFSRDGALLATAGKDGTVRVWTREGQPLSAFSSPDRVAIQSIAFSPDRRLVSSVDAGGKVRVYDLESGAERVVAVHEGSALAVAFSPEGDVLASGGVDGVRLKNLASGESLGLRAEARHISALAFSPDGRTLVAGSLEHTLRFWDVATAEGRGADAGGGGISQLAFSPDGRTLISSGAIDTGVRLWDVAAGAQRDAVRGHAGEVLQFSISPDGARLATASVDRTVRLWDLASGESRVLRGHDAPVFGVSFSPDGRRLASADRDGAVRIWLDDLPADPAGLRAFIAEATLDTPDSEDRRRPR